MEEAGARETLHHLGLYEHPAILVQGQVEKVPASSNSKQQGARHDRPVLVDVRLPGSAQSGVFTLVVLLERVLEAAAAETTELSAVSIMAMVAAAARLRLCPAAAAVACLADGR